MHSKTTDASQGSTPRKYRSRVLKVILGAVVAFLAIVAVAELVSGGSTSPTTEQRISGREEMDFVRRDGADPMAIGDVDAPVVLTEWLEMRCPFCALFSRETLPALVKEYVDSGKVRIEFHDVAFYGEESENAAIAARAAARQGKYVEFVTAVYDVAPQRSHPDLPRDELIGFARSAGVPNLDQFEADLDDPELKAAVQESMQGARRVGVNSVPFFAAGDTALSGAQPVEVFREFLDDALAEAE